MVLGAGASFCYSGADRGVPTQENLVGRLYRAHDTNSGEGMPSFVGPSGPSHSFRLAKLLRQRFNLPEDPSKKGAKLDFWTQLQEQGLNLESLYNLLDEELKGDARAILGDFAAIIRTAVSEPAGERGLESVCSNHRRLCEALEPGDYIISFNWDSLMADALLYHSHLWFPATGFGPREVFPLLPRCQKALGIESLVHLLPIHGSVVLFEIEGHAEDKRRVAFLGPRQLSAGTGLLEFLGIDMSAAQGSTSGAGPSPPPEAEEKLGAHGYLYYRGTWFKPLFVPPSRNKPHYQHWFLRGLLRFIHSQIPATKRFVIAGYSFPESDTGYLGEIFVRQILNPEASVEIINPSNGDESFRERVGAVFGKDRPVSFDHLDFRRYCEELDIEYPDRPRRSADESTTD